MFYRAEYCFANLLAFTLLCPGNRGIPQAAKLSERGAVAGGVPVQHREPVLGGGGRAVAARDRPRRHRDRAAARHQPAQRTALGSRRRRALRAGA